MTTQLKLCNLPELRARRWGRPQRRAVLSALPVALIGNYTAAVTSDRDQQRQDVGLDAFGRSSRHAAFDEVVPFL